MFFNFCFCCCVTVCCSFYAVRTAYFFILRFSPVFIRSSFFYLNLSMFFFPFLIYSVPFPAIVFSLIPFFPFFCSTFSPNFCSAFSLSFAIEFPFIYIFLFYLFFFCISCVASAYSPRLLFFCFPLFHFPVLSFIFPSATSQISMCPCVPLFVTGADWI